MLDIRYIVGSLIITVAVVAFAISLIAPVDRGARVDATLKPRIEPSRIVEKPAPALIEAPKQEPVQQTVVPAAPPVTAPVPKAAEVPAAPPPKQATVPAKPAVAPAPEVTGTIAEQRPAPKPAPQRAPVRKKEETEFQFPFQFPWLKGWQQN